jgi:hypothetical protein
MAPYFMAIRITELESFLVLICTHAHLVQSSTIKNVFFDKCKKVSNYTVNFLLKGTNFHLGKLVLGTQYGFTLE